MTKAIAFIALFFVALINFNSNVLSESHPLDREKVKCANNVVSFSVSNYCGHGVRGGFSSASVTCKDGTATTLQKEKSGCPSVQALYERAVKFCVKECREEVKEKVKERRENLKDRVKKLFKRVPTVTPAI